MTALAQKLSERDIDDWLPTAPTCPKHADHVRRVFADGGRRSLAQHRPLQFPPRRDGHQYRRDCRFYDQKAQRGWGRKVRFARFLEQAATEGDGTLPRTSPVGPTELSDSLLPQQIPLPMQRWTA
jgi:hypothetical protein